MNLRSRARAFLMQAANVTGANSLALLFQRSKWRSQGLVVAMHETPASLEAQLREQLEFASQHFEITNLEDFARIWDDNSESDASSKPLLLFTFDDGRESNYAVAAPLLESFGGRGVFFVVPAFAESGATQKALSFYRTSMNRNSKTGDERFEDWKPMTPAQIGELASRGHAIGNHTLTHQRLVGLPPEALEQEIGDSARRLASWTMKPIDAFAWTFGWDAIDVNAWRVIQRYHRFCFSPCAGAINRYRDQPSLLWRREIEARYSLPEYRFCYSGLIDLWWSNRRTRLREMVRTSSAGNAE
jgi:peptidoglycan/xylan/chitin deacetylase (PgdA/CDA1 family)